MRLISRSFFRYLIIGVVNNGTFYLALLILISFGWQAWQAVMVLNPIAVVLTFIANRNWSFTERSRGKNVVELWRYILVYGITYPLAIFLTWTLEHAGIPSWQAAFITIGVAAVAIYIALRFWVFREHRPVPAG